MLEPVPVLVLAVVPRAGTSGRTRPGSSTHAGVQASGGAHTVAASARVLFSLAVWFVITAQIVFLLASLVIVKQG